MEQELYKIEFTIDNLTKENYEKMIEGIKEVGAVKEYKTSSRVEPEVLKKIVDFVDDTILQEQLKHDNTMFSIKPEALEYFHQLYQYKTDFLTELKNKIESNFS